MNRPFIRFVNNEKRDKSSEKYPPKLPVINSTTIGKDAAPKEKDMDFKIQNLGNLK